MRSPRTGVVCVAVMYLAWLCSFGLPASAQISTTQTFCTGTTPCVVTYHEDNTRGEPARGHARIHIRFHQPAATTVATDGLIYAQPADGYIFVGGGAPGYFTSGSSSCAPRPPVGTSYSCAGQLTILH